LRFKSDQGYYFGERSSSEGPPLDSLLWGIQLFEINNDKYQEFESLLNKERVRKEAPFQAALSIEFSKKFENVIWIGTNNKGIFKYNFKDNQYEQFQPATDDSNPINDITKIVEDDNGVVWFTTPSGLGRLNTSNNQITFITEKDGLPANNVKSILIDNFKNIWVSSIVGISQILRESDSDLSSILNFTTQDGLQGFQFSFAAHKSKSSELFFGGNNGFNSFYSGKTNRIPPLIAITDLKISTQTDTFGKDESISTNDINKIEKIILSYDQNDISIEFAAIHFAYPSRNKIYYKLDGVNSDWVKDNRGFISFTNLEHGEYIFRLKAANGDGIWNDEEKAIRIIISPPWWKTTFAYIGYFFFFAGTVFGIDRVQRRRILTKERNAAAIKEANLRAQIAEGENERKTKDLEEARQLQLSMLPKQLPQLPHLDIAVYMKTATEVGGDYYDFHLHLDGTLTVVLGDATGHGMMSGMMVSIMKSLFMSDRTNKELKPFFENANEAIKDMQLGRLMMALTCVQISNNKIITTNAGMPPLFIYRKYSQSIEEVTINNMPLGSMKGIAYDTKEFKVERGDTLLLMSDGFAELKNNAKEIYGYKKARNSFEEVATKEAGEIVTFLKEEGKRWTNDKEPDDDVTFVVIKVK
jgi:serine phosphatase RsbU (regulator of sigma subunit)